jgi:hypothetical protein
MTKHLGALLGVPMLIFLQACDTPRPIDKAGVGDIGETAAPEPNRGPIPPVASRSSAVERTDPPLSKADRDPARLLRMNKQSVSSLLGDPQFVRREASARVWQYRTDSCVLDLFLYDVTSEYEVVYFEMRPAAILAGPTQGCFEKFIRRAARVAES